MEIVCFFHASQCGIRTHRNAFSFNQSIFEFPWRGFKKNSILLSARMLPRHYGVYSMGRNSLRPSSCIDIDGLMMRLIRICMLKNWQNEPALRSHHQSKQRRLILSFLAALVAGCRKSLKHMTHTSTGDLPMDTSCAPCAIDQSNQFS